MEMNVSKEGSQYQLGAAILLYQRKQGPYWSNDSAALATVHTVEQIANKPVIGAGRPMTEEDYANLISVLTPKSRPQLEWQDDCVLAKGLGRMIWWTPPMTRSMFFQKANGTNSLSGQAACPIPGMVWHTTGRELYVYAFKGDVRPTKETVLFQAPLFNVWSSGQVCLGTAQRPADEHKDDPKAWETMLFGSHFTHPNVHTDDGLIKGQTPVAFWTRMLAKPPATFPLDVLVPLDVTVAELLAPDYQHHFA